MSVFDLVKAIPIKEVVKKYLPELELNEYEHYLNAVCPFHDDGDPSFVVYPDTNSWHCFGCKRGSSTIDLVMHAKGMDTWEATKELATTWNITYQELTPEEQARQEELISKREKLGKYINWAHSQLQEEHRKALYRRGLTDEIIDRDKIGYDSNSHLGNEEVARELGFIGNKGRYLPGGRIVLPVYEYCKPVYVILWDYKHTEESRSPKYILPNGWEKPLVGQDQIRRDKPVYVVEGIFDWYSMTISGYATTCVIGTGINKEHRARLMRASTIYISLDNDSHKETNSGQDSAMKLIKQMFPKAKNILLPPGKDPNDVYQQNPGKFRDSIDQLTSQAKNALELEIKKLEELTGVDSPNREDILKQQQEIYPLIARLDSHTAKDMFVNELWRILKPMGITKKSILEELSSISRQQREEPGGHDYEEAGENDYEEAAENDDEPQLDRLLRLAEEAELFKDDVCEPYARLKKDGHYEIRRVKSSDFKNWLVSKFYDETYRGPNSNSLNTAITTLSAIAWRSEQEHKLHNRTAKYDNSFWYDLTDKQWRAVHIYENGWEVVSNPPILFNRYTHQRPQVEPDPKGDIKELLKFINLKDENARILYLVSVVTDFIPDISHVIFVFHGSEGTGKSLISKITRKVIDPSAISTCKNYRDIKEFVQYMAHNYMIIMENQTHISKELSDTICSAVTGDGNSKRALYTDDDDVIYNFKRTFIINGINNVATEADLLRRSVLFQLDYIPNEAREEEMVFMERFEKAKPFILGGIFNVLSKAMKIYPDVKLQVLYSMADYTRWGYAVAEALGYGGKAFLAAYSENQGLQTDEAITNSPVALAVTIMMEDQKTWESTPTDLLDKLKEFAEKERINTRDKKLWPQNPSSLSKKLNEYKTVLLKSGIEVEHVRSGKQRLIAIKNLNYNSDLANKEAVPDREPAQQNETSDFNIVRRLDSFKDDDFSFVY